MLKFNQKLFLIVNTEKKMFKNSGEEGGQK